jgi:hypothetical protein
MKLLLCFHKSSRVGTIFGTRKHLQLHCEAGCAALRKYSRRCSQCPCRLGSAAYASPSVITADGTTGLVACASIDGTVRVLKLDSGHEVSAYSLPGHVFSSPVWAAEGE